MSNAIAVITKSSFGKSTSIGNIKADEKNRLAQDIEGLKPEESFLINIKGKPLPWGAWKRQYRPGTIDGTNLAPYGYLDRPDGLKVNYIETTDPGIIINTLNHINNTRLDVKNVVIDDFQYLMAEEFMNNALKVGYEKFSKMAKNAYDVINTGLKMRGSICFIILTHQEETKDSYKMKTIGKMLDEKVTLEGLFTIILYGKESYDSTQKTTKKEFVTNFDGEYPAKSPIGMFENLYIPNDLGLVTKTVHEYYNG